jgi:hypothetical protein
MDPNKRARLIVKDGLVRVKDLAESIGKDRSLIRKDLTKRGIPMDKLRDRESRGQRVLVVTRADAERYIATVKAESLGNGGDIVYIDV